MQIDVDVDRCCGSGNCVRLAPEVFDQNDDGIVVVLDPNPTGLSAHGAHEAAELCPTWAIVATMTESGDGEECADAH